MQQIQGAYADEFDIEIYAGNEISDASLMYDSNPNASAVSPYKLLKRIDRIAVGNHQWTIALAGLPAFEQKMNYGRPGLILRSGVSISLLLALLVWVFLDDRTRAIQAAYQASQLALYDTLTGLPNRKLIVERLAQTIVKAKRENFRVAVLFIDLDKFKPVNDEFGHAVGDLLLKEVAIRLQSCMRESDTVARLGGDEFVALLAHVNDRHSAEVAAEKMLQTLKQPFEVAGHCLNIAASIGIAVYPEDGLDHNSLIKSADLAMYEAKNRSRGAGRFRRQ
jgi:diguanylate cyclase (GGDEF)-like protein